MAEQKSFLDRIESIFRLFENCSWFCNLFVWWYRFAIVFFFKSHEFQLLYTYQHISNNSISYCLKFITQAYASPIEKKRSKYHSERDVL